jgi:hypothetical protein
MITDTIEFIQLRIDQMLADINRSEEQFLRNYADSNKIQIAYMLGQREMLAKMLLAAQEEE